MQNDLGKIASSILAANFAGLGEQVGEAEHAGADRIHVDVMDGHFVPNLSMGVPIAQSLRRITRLPVEIRLMFSDPDFFLDEFVETGSDSFVAHWEGNNNLHRTVQRIGSVIASWLLDLTATALVQDAGLSKFAGRVSDSGEGRWTIKAAIDEAVPTPVLTASLYELFSSRGEADFADKLLSAMRYEFGGHLEKPAEKPEAA